MASTANIQLIFLRNEKRSQNYYFSSIHATNKRIYVTENTE